MTDTTPRRLAFGGAIGAAVLLVTTVSPAAAAPPVTPPALVITATADGLPAFGAGTTLVELDAAGQVVTWNFTDTDIRGEADYKYLKVGARYTVVIDPESNTQQAFDGDDYARTWFGSTASYEPVPSGTFTYTGEPLRIAVPLLAGYTVTGSIDHPVGNPVVRVSDTRTDNHIVGRQISTWFDGSTRVDTLATAFTTAGDGTYSIGGLAPGPAVIGVVPSSASGYGAVYNGEYTTYDLAAEHPFTITDGTNTLDQHLLGNGALTGHVTFEGLTRGGDFSWYPTNVEVVAQDDPSTVIASTRFSGGSVSNPGAWFTFPHLTQGTYLVRARLEREGAQYLSTWFGGLTAQTATPLTVIDGETTDIATLLVPKNPDFRGFQLSATRSPYIDLHAEAPHGDPFYGVHLGDVLHVSGGQWKTIRVSGMTVSLRYQWTRNGQPIVGATDGTYTLTTSDVATSIGVTVVAYGANYVDSEPIPINPVYLPSLGSIVNTSAPTVASVSKTVRGVRTTTYTATPGAWSRESIDLSYDWAVNGVVSATHTASFAYSGKGSVVLTVRASRPGYTPGTSTPKVVRKGIVAPTATGKLVLNESRDRRPVTSSTTRVRIGETLISGVTRWKYADATATPSSETYQWQRSTNRRTWTSIRGETTPSHTVTYRDAGKYLRVVVTARSTQFPSAKTAITAGFAR